MGNNYIAKTMTKQMRAITKQATNIESKIKKDKKELMKKEFTATSKDAAVTIVMKGNREAKEVIINPLMIHSMETIELERSIKEVINSLNEQINLAMKSITGNVQDDFNKNVMSLLKGEEEKDTGERTLN